MRRLALGCALFALSCIALAAWTLDSTIDEPFHLDYAHKTLDGEVPERLGIYNSKTPALVPSALAERLALRAGVPASKALAVTRLTTALYFVALLVIVFHLTRRFADANAAWFAVLCCSLEPNLVAHAALNTVDVPFAAANLLALWAMLAFARQAGWRTALGLGVALGLAFTIKYTGLYLAPAALSLAFWKRDGAWPAARECLRRAGWLSLAVLLSMLVISACYFFREVGKPLSEYPFVTQPFRQLAAWLGWLPLPLPDQFLLGADMVLAFERQASNVLLLGRQFETGVWYYFAVLWFFKTPIALMAASLAGAWIGWRCGAFRQPGLKLLFFQWALYFAYFSFLFHTQLGYRYVLMLVPMSCVLLAVGTKDWWAKPRGALLAAAVAALSLVELLPYYGHTLPFSNSFLLPKRNAFHVLADSNLYWNEYHAQIPALLRAHRVSAVINPAHILPGRNAFDGIELGGVFGGLQQQRWVREKLETSGHVKHVIFVYDVSEGDFSRFLDENRRYLPIGAARCGGASHAAVQVAAQDKGWMWLCAYADGPADISLGIGDGTAKAGVAGRDGGCRGDEVGKDQEIWFRLEPGQHMLCLETGGALSGRWSVRRGTASLHLTEGGR